MLGKLKEILILLLRCLCPLQKCCSLLALITLFFKADLFWEKNFCGLIIWFSVYMLVYIHVSFAIYPCNNLGKWRLKAFCYVHIPQANWSARIIRSIKWYGIDSQSSIKVLTQVHLGQICSFFSCIYYKTWKKKKTVIFVLQHLSRKEKVCIWCH